MTPRGSRCGKPLYKRRLPLQHRKGGRFVAPEDVQQLRRGHQAAEEVEGTSGGPMGRWKSFLDILWIFFDDIDGIVRMDCYFEVVLLLVFCYYCSYYDIYILLLLYIHNYITVSVFLRDGGTIEKSEDMYGHEMFMGSPLKWSNIQIKWDSWI